MFIKHVKNNLIVTFINNVLVSFIVTVLTVKYVRSRKTGFILFFIKTFISGKMI